MVIQVLVEDTTSSSEIQREHGLSLYIENKQNKILFDTGASELFAQNAAKMKVDLSKVDFAIISHGHSDHGGGLQTFLNQNDHAPIYFNTKAFEPHYANRANGNVDYIGLDSALLPNERFRFVDQQHVIHADSMLFSGVSGKRLLPSGNSDLKVKRENAFAPDDFGHEQSLILNEDQKTVLIVGCAHTGIVNIVEHFYQLRGCFPHVIVGGFHLSNPGRKQNEKSEQVLEVAQYLLQTKAKCYTGHCTGIESFHTLQSVMGEQVEYLSTGKQFCI